MTGAPDTDAARVGIPPQPMVDGPRRRHFPCFDGLRAIAAIGVFLHHLGFQTAASYNTPAGAYLARMDSGVSVFFLISGFLLYRPFAASHIAGSKAPGTGRFYLRRAGRIFPAYWAALTGIVVFFGLRFHGLRDVLTFYALAQIYDRHRYFHGISQAWTLATEVSFYALLPLYAWALARLTRRRSQRSRVAAEVGGVVILGLAGFTFRVAVDFSHGTFGLLGIYWLPSWLDLFAAGMLLAILSVATEAGLAHLRPAAAAGRHPGWCWAGAGAVFWVAATRLNLPRGLEAISPKHELAKHLCYAAVAFLLLLPAVFGPEERGLVRRFLSSRIMVALGTISYGIYLWHQALIEQARAWTGADLSHLGGNPWAVGLIALAGTIVAAGVSWNLVERPALGMVHRTQTSISGSTGLRRSA